jgi:hypothetical protein
MHSFSSKLALVCHGTHSIFVMFSKELSCTTVIPLLERSRRPPCVGQEPDRISVAPA